MALAMAVAGRRGRAKGGPSVREVCLLGVARPMAAGDRVDWSGRAYRVEVAQGPAEAGAPGGGYVHLAPASSAPGTG